MRAGKLALVLTAGLATHAWAQATPERARDTARQADVPRTATASSLQGYALLLQEAESRLRQAKEAAARAPEQSQPGAVSNERGELAEAGQAALRKAEVARHHDHRVLEVHGAALAVGEAAVVEDLK